MKDLSGRSLGRYRLDAVLGQGGMAAVYRAEDTKLGRAVAVKVILPIHASDSHFVERFLREARLVAALEHPNILPVYDFGEENGLPYLVMPYLEGGTLRDRMLKRNGVPSGAALSFVKQLAEALDAAHAAGVLHRDVKPANVLLGKEDRVFLGDFGIAKALESMTGLTATGVVVGTPIYMAPEQAQGKPASPASDRYALGVLAYELFAGQPPFEGESALSLMHQHVTTPPPRISGRSLLPPALDEVFARVLSKDAAARPPSCRAFAESLAEALPPAFASPSSPTRSWGPGTGTGTDATVVGGPSFPSSPASEAKLATPRPPSLTSEATIATTSAPRGAARYAIAGVVAAGLIALLAVLTRRGETPVEPRISPAKPQAAPAPVAPTAPVSEPASVVVEEDAASSKEVDALVAALDDAIAARRLVKPAPKNALDALIALRTRFPASPRVPEGERRLVVALKADAQGRLATDDFSGARDVLLKAQVLRPGDPEIQSLLEVASSGAARLAASRGPGFGEPPPPPPPQPQPPGGPSAEGYAERLDPGRRGGRRPSAEDLAAVLASATEALRADPSRADAQFWEAFCRGAIAYQRKQDAEAASAIVSIVEMSRRSHVREARRMSLWASMAPDGWRLAVAYFDLRREAEPLLAKALAASPGDARTLLGRAELRRFDQKDAEALADAQSAWEGASGGDGPVLRCAAAEFSGDLLSQKQRWPEALTWYRRAVDGFHELGPARFVLAPMAQSVAFRAGTIAREKLSRESEALDFFRVACKAGMPAACAEAGMESERPRDRFARPLRKR
ncbi:MAG: serine/threonine protein kinase [Acidobacteria bacterium]|nr:serine/threonine protein kinase [Acidobacteriota bacterium]